MFFIRAVLVAFLLISIFLLGDVVSGIVYLLCVTSYMIEYLLSKKMQINSKFEKYAVPITNALIILIPLINLAVKKRLTLLLVFVIVCFDLFAELYYYSDKWTGKLKGKHTNLHDIYVIALTIALFMSFFTKVYYIYALYVSCVLCSAYLIWQSIRFNISKDQKEEEKLTPPTDTTENSISKEIVNTQDKNNEIIE